MYTYVQTVCTKKGVSGGVESEGDAGDVYKLFAQLRKGVRGGMESEGKEWRSEEEE